MRKAGVQGSFAGVVKIVRFNLRFYLFSAAALAGAGLLVASKRLAPLVEWMVILSAAVTAFWTLSSLFVSWYVYDYAGVTRWQWLPNRLPILPECWANIHAGLDESTSVLRQLLPGTVGSVVDIYDPGEMTEPSIARARRIHPTSEPFERGTYNELPLSKDSCDAVFILFAAHEVRDEEHRTLLLRQGSLALRGKGSVILVEHLRDWRNFIAFGPGFFHFYSRQNWLRNIQDAGLIVTQEGPVTPFVECFVLQRANP
jgi:hypothetical protein